MCCCVLQLGAAAERTAQFNERDLLEVTQRALNNMPAGVSPIQNIDQRASQIIRGGNIAYLILNNQKLPFDVDIQHRQEYLNAIVDLIWYFYSIAINKGQAFQEGTFVLADRGFAFYNFLMRYVQLVNPDAKNDPDQDKANMGSDNPYGYSRLSSHFVTTQRGHTQAGRLGGSYQGLYRHYGIDVRFEQDPDFTALPTGNKSHILFGKIQENPDMIFIKIEKAGIYRPPLSETAQKILPSPLQELAGALPGKEQLKHLIDWTRAQIPKILETKLSKEAVDLLRDWIEFDDNSYNRKERYPRDIIDNIFSALGSSPMPPDLTDRFVRWTAILGIKYPYLIMQYCETGEQRYLDILHAYMRTYSGSSLAENAQGQLADIVKYLHQDSELYTKLKDLVCDLIQKFDHNSLRTGREVLLTWCDLLSSYVYHDRVMGKNNPQIDEIINAFAQSTTMIKMPFNIVDVGQRVNNVREYLLQQVQNPIIRLPKTNIKTLLGMCFDELYEEWNIYISALEYMLGERNQTLFSQPQPPLVQSLTRRMPYRQLMRSLPLIKDEQVQNSVAQVIKAKISELNNKGILTIAILQNIAHTVPALYVPAIIPEKLISEVRQLSEQELSALKNEIFGRRIILVNNHKELVGNPRPRLLVQGLKGNEVVWQIILEHGASVDIGSCDTNHPDNATMIRYQPYGETEKFKSGLLGRWIGVASQPTDIAMEALLQIGPIKPDQCLVVTINDATQRQFNTAQCNKHQIRSWQEAFPTIQYYASRLSGWYAYTFEQLKSQYPTDLARYVLALPKENITPSQVIYRVKRLLNEWDPRLYPEQTELVKQIIGLVNWACATLLLQISSDPMHLLLQGQIAVSQLSDQQIEALMARYPDIPSSVTMSNRERLERYIQEHQSK